MRPGRLLLLLLTASLGLLGAANGRPGEPAAPSASTASISSSRAPLPTPAHDEATCPFCQTALFPPCTPASAAALVAPADLIRLAVPVPDARVRHAAVARPPSSRAPPSLRFV